MQPFRYESMLICKNICMEDWIYNFPSVQLCNYVSMQPYEYAIIQVYRLGSISFLSMKPCKYSCMKVHKCVVVHICKYSSVQVCEFLGIHVYKYTNLQERKYEGLKVCKFQSMWLRNYVSMQCNHMCVQLFDMKVKDRHVWSAISDLFCLMFETILKNTCFTSASCIFDKCL